MDTSNKRIAYIQAGWHKEIVEHAYEGFTQCLIENELDINRIDRYHVPGSLEIPLFSKQLAKTNRYELIIAAGFIVDGGIYRHDFVASAVLNGIMQVQLDSDVPILSVVLTPHQFQESQSHVDFFKQHFVTKGIEAAQASMAMLAWKSHRPSK